MAARIRTRILETVRRLFLKQVYPQTSLKQIAQVARVTEGSIYCLFGSRLRMNQCVLLDTFARIRDATRKLVTERGLSNVAVRDIAQAVGLEENELLFLFPSREALLAYALSTEEHA